MLNDLLEGLNRTRHSFEISTANIASIPKMVSARHIQNMSEASARQHHWGYADRAIPCTNDPGSCAYLDVVYHSHDLGMMYCGILWATIGGILFIWGVGRHLIPSLSHEQRLSAGGEYHVPNSRNTIRRIKNSIASVSRHHLLPESLRPVFGRTTRLQVLILLTLTGYLTIWSFVGIVYNKWVTPVKNMPGVYNTRTSLGAWSDRIGVLAYALTPLSVLLSSRESLLSIITGVPYQSFNFLHRWLGYIIFVQSAFHTIGWSVIELRLYQPQPKVGLGWISQTYMIWGVIAMFFLTIIFALSTPWGIRLTGYEFFRKCHYVVAMLYIGACWGHWSKLNCYMIPSLVIWFIDRGARLARTGLLHYSYLPNGHMGFQSANAEITYFPDPDNGHVVRLDFTHPHDAWDIGQHFYLCFPEISIWQSHPFTPGNLPGNRADGSRHTYIVRAKKGATRSLADLAATRQTTSANEKAAANTAVSPSTPVILSGPYGGSIVGNRRPDANILCVAGGTGVTFVLPVLLDTINQAPVEGQSVELIWAVRRDGDLSWIRQELEVVRQSVASHNVRVRIFVTRQNELEDVCEKPGHDSTKPHLVDSKIEVSSESTSAEDLNKTSGSSRGSFFIQHTSSVEGSDESRHPNLGALVHGFLDSTIKGPTTVYASGPGSMISDLRKIVASCNDAGKVWRGDERFDVQLSCDDRLEW